MNTLPRWQKNLLNSIQLQLFISFISLPFLIAWGLPISLLSPISTLIFGPFLTCFLLISSLIFFAELLYVPNQLLIWCLEKVTAMWLLCLNVEQKSWLIGFSKPAMIVLGAIPLIALMIIHSKKIIGSIKHIVILFVSLIGICVILKFFPYTYKTYEKIPCNKGEITLINHKKALIMFDPAYIASRPSYESFISYTLVPGIIEKSGKLEIDHLIIGKINKRIFDALQFLATKITIKNIYLPYWNGKIPSFAWQSYAYLKKTITSNHGKIISLSYKKQIQIDKDLILTIEPAIKDIAYYDATYRPLSLTLINEKAIAVYNDYQKHIVLP